VGIRLLKIDSETGIGLAIAGEARLAPALEADIILYQVVNRHRRSSGMPESDQKHHKSQRTGQASLGNAGQMEDFEMNGCSRSVWLFG
jgi:hypothetical protein